MNKIVTLPKIIAMMVDTTGQPKDVCETFVVTLARMICDALVADGIANVSGLGQFVYTPDATGKVAFIPTKALSAAINAPFDAFEPEELCPQVTARMLGLETTDDDDDATPPAFFDFFLKQP